MIKDFSSLRGPVLAALEGAFGSAQADSITPMVGGASGAFPFRVEIGERRYVVRVEGEASPLRNPNQYRSMQIAADAGIAPALHYVDEATRVSVMDFIDEKAIADFPGGKQALVLAVGHMLKRLQTIPLFPAFVEYPDIVDRLWQWVCRTGLFAEGALDPHTERLSRIRESSAGTCADLVSSHNALVPRNLLFDGRRLWLIDWESAYRNDPLVDVAIALDNFTESPDMESEFLQAWLGGRPHDAFYAQLGPVRALTRLYYAGVLLSASFAASGALGDPDTAAPSVAEFRRAVAEGRLKPGAAQTKHILGKMYLRSFLTGAPPPGLAAAT